jgi:hypothetical protein
MHWSLWILVAVIVAVAFDRTMLAAEQRGWVYWRRRKPSPGTVAGAMLSLHALLEPSQEHVVREQERQAADIDVAGNDEPLGPRAPR